MPRDTLTRMDVDSAILYHRKVRKLQAREPERWPAILAAWLGLLGEAWKARTREVTLEDSWCPALTMLTLADADAALRAVQLIDGDGFIKQDSWDEWFGPALLRVENARNAAAVRWERDRNAYSQPASQPTKPSQPSDSHPPTPRRGAKNEGRNAGALIPLADAMRQAGIEPPPFGAAAAGGNPLTPD